MTPNTVAIVEKIVRVVFHPTQLVKYSFLQKILLLAALLVAVVPLLVTNDINTLLRGTFCVIVIAI